MSASNSLPCFMQTRCNLFCDFISCILATTLLAILVLPSISAADEIQKLSFSAESIIRWEIKSFKGETVYKIISDNGRKVIQADSKSTASGLFKKVSLDPASFRYLRWSWKIKNTIPVGFESKKNGDDYAARVYVIFPGRFFWHTKAINYIWANHLPKGQIIPNAFSANAMMVAVESGPDQTGKWIFEERDILTDYRKLFGSEPHEIGAIAIMTDTDNTGTEATAWYGEISIGSQK